MTIYNSVKRNNLYTIVWILNGKGNCILDFNTYNYTKNKLFCFTPFQAYKFIESEKTEAIVIHFHNDFFCIHKHQKEVSCDGILFNNIYKQPYININSEEETNLQWLVNSMKNELNNKNIASYDSILSYLKLFLINCTRIKNQFTKESESNKEEKNNIVLLKKLIEENYKTKHSPKEYAGLLFISPKALASYVKKETGKTVSQLIKERLIVEAKRELYLTQKSVKEIAFYLGYKDEYYFSRFFKKQTDLSPTKYRVKMKLNETTV